MSWQPIETAPKHCRILVYVDGCWITGRFISSKCFAADFGYPVLGQCKPTHWMPLPDPPK